MISLIILGITTLPVTLRILEEPQQIIDASGYDREERRDELLNFDSNIFDEFVRTFYRPNRKADLSYNKLYQSRNWELFSMTSILIFIISLPIFLYAWASKKLNLWEKSIFIIFIIFIFTIKLFHTTFVYYHTIYPLIPLIIVIAFKNIDRRVLVIIFVILLVVNGIRLYTFGRITNDPQKLERMVPAYNHIDGKVFDHIEPESGSRIIMMESERERGIKLLTDGVDIVTIEGELDRYADYPEKYYDFYDRYIEKNTYMILPTEDWNKTVENDKTIYWCDRYDEDDWCYTLKQTFENYTEDNNITYNVIETIETKSNNEVFEIVKID